jgi:DNA polymerase III sliding clamp (beta) subunit (PCNA family)
MKIDQKEINRALKTVTSVTMRKEDVVEAYQSLYVRVDGEKMTFSSYSPDVFCATAIDVQEGTLQPFLTSIPYHFIPGIIALGDFGVTSIDLSGEVLRFKTGKTFLSINCSLLPESIPPPEEYTDKGLAFTQLKNPTRFLDDLRRTMVQAKDGMHNYMGTVLFSEEEMISTNGHCLFRTKNPLEGAEDYCLSPITASKLVNFLQNAEKEVFYNVNGTSFCFKDETSFASFKTQSLTYPNYKAVLEQSRPGCIKLSKGDIVKSLLDFKLFCKGDYVFWLKKEGSVCSLKLEGAFGEAATELPLITETDSSFSFSLNIDYLLKACHNARNTEIEISYGSATTPLRVHEEGYDAYVCSKRS